MTAIKSSRRSAAATLPWWRKYLPASRVLAAMLIAAALLGGSSRADIASLLVLRPLAAMMAVLALLQLSRTDFHRYRGLILLLCATVALVVVQLVPLPPALWQGLPGRDLIARIDAVAGLGDIWRPMALDPIMARNALWALMVPIAILCLAVKLDHADDLLILRFVLVIGALSGLVGVLQFVEGPSSALYYYMITNKGSAVGLFANRNHQGVFLAMLMPLAAAAGSILASRPRQRRHDRRDARIRPIIASGVFVLLLLPMILTTGSRAGLLAAALGLACAVAITLPTLKLIARDRPPGGARPGFRMFGMGAKPALGVAVAAIALGTMFALIGLQEGNSVARLVTADDQPELRWPLWHATAQIAAANFPIGTGVGSFVRVFQIHEPAQFLSPSYINHAHNDYLEFLMEGGVAGLMIMVGLAVLYVGDGWKAWRAEPTAPVLLARASWLALGLLALGSLADYPARAPLMAAVATLLFVWLRRGATATDG